MPDDETSFLKRPILVPWESQTRALFCLMVPTKAVRSALSDSLTTSVKTMGNLKQALENSATMTSATSDAQGAVDNAETLALSLEASIANLYKNQLKRPSLRDLLLAECSPARAFKALQIFSNSVSASIELH